MLRRATSIPQLYEFIGEFFSETKSTPEKLAKAVDGMERRLDACLLSGGQSTDNKTKRDRLLREMEETWERSNANFVVDIVGDIRYDFEFGNVPL